LKQTKAFGVTKLPIVKSHLLRLVVYVYGQTVLAQKIIALETRIKYQKKTLHQADKPCQLLLCSVRRVVSKTAPALKRQVELCTSWQRQNLLR
jgi:hypothetical protein